MEKYDYLKISSEQKCTQLGKNTCHMLDENSSNVFNLENSY